MFDRGLLEYFSRANADSSRALPLLVTATRLRVSPPCSVRRRSFRSVSYNRLQPVSATAAAAAVPHHSHDNGSLTCPHLPFSRSRKLQEKELVYSRHIYIYIHRSMQFLIKIEHDFYVKDTRFRFSFNIGYH